MTSLCHKRKPTNAYAQKPKAQRELTNAYLNEQIQYIQGQIKKIRNSVKDRQSWIVWLTVNDVSKRRSIMIVKLKAATQEEQIDWWKEYFTNLGKSPKVIDKPITKIINNQQDIKQGQFMQEGLDGVQIKIKHRKAGGLDKIPPEVWKTR